MDDKFVKVPKEIEDGTWFSNLIRELKSQDHIQQNLMDYEKIANQNLRR